MKSGVYEAFRYERENEKQKKQEQFYQEVLETDICHCRIYFDNHQKLLPKWAAYVLLYGYISFKVDG